MGKEFYGHPENNLYEWKILKLHGSLNWFHYLPRNVFSTSPEMARELPLEMQENIMLRNQTMRSPLMDTTSGWFLNPLIIPLVLYKESMYQIKLFSNLWKQARELLAKCNRLIVIGYSFPPTDFAVKKLFLESFENNKLEELIVVNPDTSVVKTIKELTHFSKPVLLCSNLREFL